jgi:hypothetical protein
MAAVTKNRNFFKWPKLLYFKPECAFLAWWPSWLEVGITGHNFARGPSKNHFSKVWLRLAQWFQRRRFFFNFIPPFF